MCPASSRPGRGVQRRRPRRAPGRRRCSASARGTSARSSSRKCASPWSTKMSAIGWPAAASIVGVGVVERDAERRAASRARRCVLPAPGRSDQDDRAGPSAPLTTCASSRGWTARYAVWLRRVSATESPPNFSSAGLGEHQRDHRLGDDPGGRDGAHVGALVDGLGAGLAGGTSIVRGPAARWRSASSRRAPAAPRRWTCRPRCRRRARCGGG